jgi:hypothetical protein
MFLDQWERDVSRGHTTGALFERLEKHEERDDERFRFLTGETSGIAERIATVEGKLNGGGTGLFSNTRNSRETCAPIVIDREKPLPWWALDPFKSVLRYLLVALAAGVLAWLHGHFLSR